MPSAATNENPNDLLRGRDIYSSASRPGLLPIRRSTFYQAVIDGDLPPPAARFGKRIPLWRRGDILAAVAANARGAE